VVTIYNNAVVSSTWDSKYPKDAKILALATEVQELKDMHIKMYALASNAGILGHQKSTSKSGGGSRVDITEWRMTEATLMVQRDGKTWYWCPHHVYEDMQNGLYVTQARRSR